MVSEVGEEMREGSLCPKCHRPPLAIRFRTNSGTRTKDRFLACAGYSTGECSGFTWHLSSSSYNPSQRLLSQALSGARDVPGRPPLVRDVLAAKRVEEASETVESRGPVDLSGWLASSRFLPESLMLDTLSEVAPDLADQHRRAGSPKHVILRAVKAKLEAGA